MKSQRKIRKVYMGADYKKPLFFTKRFSILLLVSSSVVAEFSLSTTCEIMDTSAVFDLGHIIYLQSLDICGYVQIGTHFHVPFITGSVL